MPALGVKPKPHIFPVYPRVKEIVAAWGEERGIMDEGWDGGG